MSFVASKNSNCHFCGKTVYAMERMDADGKSMHKACFKCEHCQCVLKLGNFAAMGGRYFCKPHFKQLFKEKGNYHSGFGSEDAKSKWAPQAVVYGAPGANFMKAGSEWDSRQTKSFRMPRPRANTDVDDVKVSSLTSEPKAAEVSSAPSSPAPAATTSSTSPSTSPAKPAGDFKAPRESLAQLASVGALKSVGERWGTASGPAADASRDQRRRAALEARKAETSPVPEKKNETTEPAVKEEQPAAQKAVEAPTPAAPAKTVEELKAELEEERAKFAADKAALADAKAKFEVEKKTFEEDRKAFDEKRQAFEEAKRQWEEAHPQQVEAPVAAEVQA